MGFNTHLFFVGDLSVAQASAGQANGPALLRFEWTICDNGVLRQPDLADLNFLPGLN